MSDEEGRTPLHDYSDLKLSWVKKRSQLDAVEGENINRALKKYLGGKKVPFPDWFTIEHINQVHKEMLGDVWAWAGKYRKSEKTIGIDAYKIPSEMGNLQNDIHFWGTEKSIFLPIEIAVSARPQKSLQF